MREVTLQEMLEARDRRCDAQRRLLDSFGLPLVSFTMNIPGPVKDSPLIRRGFHAGLRLLDEALDRAGFACLSRQLTHAVTGNELLCTVDAPAEKLKAICTLIEDESPMGRLYDMDVIAPDGQKLARAEERRCLCCGAVGRGCASRRLHSLDELRAAVEKLLRDGLLEADAENIDRLAAQALLNEVDTTPKPGLVDRDNNGAHRDMTPETFARLRAPGKLAEGEMLHASGGVNTHKGAIFTLGTVCGAIGRLWRPDAPCRDPEPIARSCADLCRDAVAADFAGMKQSGAGSTAGERLYLSAGLRGIRGELAAGLPAVIETGLPVLEACLGEGMSRSDAGVTSLLYLIARGEDTNMIKRGGAALAKETCALVQQELQRNPRPAMERVRELDERFIRQNLSPGGGADLLAVSYCLHDWKQNLQTE